MDYEKLWLQLKERMVVLEAMGNELQHSVAHNMLQVMGELENTDERVGGEE